MTKRRSRHRRTIFQIVPQRSTANDFGKSFYDKAAPYCSTSAQQSAVILFASNQAISLTTKKRMPYILSGAVTPISPNALAKAILAASQSRSRAKLIARSAGSLETTRQSR